MIELYKNLVSRELKKRNNLALQMTLACGVKTFEVLAMNSGEFHPTSQETSKVFGHVAKRERVPESVYNFGYVQPCDKQNGEGSKGWRVTCRRRR